MSDNTNIDDEIKSMMANYEVRPPQEAWENIIKQRSYGHVTANRIMQGFFLMSIIAALTLLGIYSFYSSTTIQAKYSSFSYTEFNEPECSSESHMGYNNLAADSQKVVFKKSASKPAEASIENLPEQDVTASVGMHAFHLDPKVFADRTLSKLLNKVEDISVIKPFELLRYKRLNKIESRPATSFEGFSVQPKEHGYWEENPFGRKKNLFSALVTYNNEFINKTFYLKQFLPANYDNAGQEINRERKAHTFSGRVNYKFGKVSFIEIGLDWTKISESSEVSQTSYNGSFSMLSIPVLFGQELHFNRWGWEVKAGLSYQFQSIYKGQIYGPDGIGQINLGSSLDNPYRSAGVFNLHIASGILYQISEDVKILLEPYYKRSLNSLTESDSPFTEKLEYMGIAAGLKFDF